MRLILELVVTFFKIGLFSFGGGYAMISLLSEEVTKKGYMDIHEFMDIVAVSQITPGPVAVNMATFVGFRQAGIIGAVFATLGVCLPSFFLVLITLKFISKFKNSNLIESMFYGLRPAVTGLIFAACVQIAVSEILPDTGFQNISSLQVNFKAVFIAVAAFIALFKFKFNPIYTILAAALLGLLIF